MLMHYLNKLYIILMQEHPCESSYLSASSFHFCNGFTSFCPSLCFSLIGPVDCVSLDCFPCSNHHILCALLKMIVIYYYYITFSVKWTYIIFTLWKRDIMQKSTQYESCYRTLSPRLNRPFWYNSRTITAKREKSYNP